MQDAAEAAGRLYDLAMTVPNIPARLVPGDFPGPGRRVERALVERADGTTLGVKFEANLTAGAAQAITLHTLQTFTGSYVVRFDAWVLPFLQRWASKSQQEFLFTKMFRRALAQSVRSRSVSPTGILLGFPCRFASSTQLRSGRHGGATGSTSNRSWPTLGRSPGSTISGTSVSSSCLAS